MAITILPQDEQRNEFGNAISQGLQMLAQHKLTGLQQQRQARGLQSLGIPASEAASLSLLPQDLQGLVLKNYLASAENTGLQQALGGLSGQQQEQPAFAQLAAQTQQPAGQQVAAPQEGEQFSRLLRNPRLKPEHRLKIEALKQQRDIADQKENNKETLPVYQNIVKSYKSAKDSDKSLNRMEQLINTGKLTSPAFHNLFKTLAHGAWGVGVDLHFLENPESQEFSKLSSSFIKHAKDIFGGRVTDSDLKVFLQTIPTLANSDEGKRRVIDVLRSENEAAKIRKQALDAILKKNGGRRPANLESLIDDEAGPQLDALAEKFKTRGIAEGPSKTLLGGAVDNPAYVLRNPVAALLGN